MSWAIKAKSYSQRRACRLVGIDPRVYRYRSRRPDDADLRERLRDLAGKHRRFGYRRLHILIEREGVHVNWKKLYRLYREERLTVRRSGRTQTRAWHACANADPARAQSALEPGLCI